MRVCRLRSFDRPEICSAIARLRWECGATIRRGYARHRVANRRAPSLHKLDVVWLFAPLAHAETVGDDVKPVDPWSISVVISQEIATLTRLKPMARKELIKAVA